MFDCSDSWHEAKRGGFTKHQCQPEMPVSSRITGHHITKAIKRRSSVNRRRNAKFVLHLYSACTSASISSRLVQSFQVSTCTRYKKESVTNNRARKELGGHASISSGAKIFVQLGSTRVAIERGIKQ
jgi:hypothetical protein